MKLISFIVSRRGLFGGLALLLIAWGLALHNFATAEKPDTGMKPFDWPQWQGPDRTAVSKETGLLKEWPKDGPPLAWQVKDLGGGYSAFGRRRPHLRDVQPRQRGGCLGPGREDRQGTVEHAPERSLHAAHGPGEGGLGLHADRRRRPCLRAGAGRRPRLPAGCGWQGRLAQEPYRRLRRNPADMVLPRIAADRRRQADYHARRQGRHSCRPQQEDRCCHVEGSGVGGRRGGVFLSHRHRPWRAAPVRPVPPWRRGWCHGRGRQVPLAL